MGLSCCVPGCSHKNGRELCSLYNFPNENDGSDWKQWYDLWCERIGKSHKGGSEHGHGWLPTTWSRVCSCHFKEEERWKPRTRQPGLKFRAPIYFPFTNGSSGNFAKSAPMNKTPLLAGLRVDTGMKSSLLAGLNVKIVPSDKESDPSSKQNSRSPPTDTAESHSPNSQTTKREILHADEISAKKSKINYDDNEKIDSDGEYSRKSAKDHGSTAMNLSTTSTKKSEDGDVVLVTSEGKKSEMSGQQKSGPKDSKATLNERLLKALTQTNSPAVQVIHTPSPASNSPVPMNISSQSSSASAYSSLVQMNAKSQIPVIMSSRTMAPQSKYAELLAVIEDMGRDIRPTYSGSRTATERLKRGIVHARALVRECLAETERSARS